MKRLIISLMVVLLLGLAAFDNAYSQDKPTKSIHQAAVDGDVDQVTALLGKGEDVNLENRMGWTPLLAAVSNRRQAVVELLLSKGANVNVKDKRARTALFIAAETGQKEVLELLVAKGADVNVTTATGENALSVAKKGGKTEIADFLTKHGATEPVLQDLEGDMYGGPGRGMYRENPAAAAGPARGRVAAAAPVPGEVDVLADPNAIKAKIKTFKDMDKSLATVAAKSQSEMRNWEQTRYDNRTILARAVDQQIEDELGYVKKIAVEEKAKKTTAAIDQLLARREERFKHVNKELLQQKRDLRETESTGTRGRTRVSSRTTTRGRSPQTGAAGSDMGGDAYGGPYGTAGTDRNARPGRPEEQLDAETEQAISLWSQATIDKKEDLAKSVNEQVKLEIVAVRRIAVEEKAEKTTAAIDGVLLARQERFDVYAKKMEQERLKLQQQTADPRTADAYGNTGRSRTRGRTSLRGDTGATQQQGSSGTARRRR
ncbi:MAG: ankyrin repeat domain-containing protein [Planctomycetota bacterium]